VTVALQLCRWRGGQDAYGGGGDARPVGTRCPMWSVAGDSKPREMGKKKAGRARIKAHRLSLGEQQQTEHPRHRLLLQLPSRVVAGLVPPPPHRLIHVQPYLPPRVRQPHRVVEPHPPWPDVHFFLSWSVQKNQSRRSARVVRRCRLFEPSWWPWRRTPCSCSLSSRPTHA